MSQPLGIVTTGAQLGLGSALFKPRRALGAFTAQITIEEHHEDQLEITDHPIEQGAVISDHAYIRPAELTIKCGWSNSPSRGGLIDGVVGGLSATVSGAKSLFSGNSENQVRDVYAKLLDLQASAKPFDIYTGKRKYTNMLIRSLATVTDRDTENSLMITVTCRQVIIVSTQVVSVPAPAERQANPSATAPPTNAGTKSLMTGSGYSNAGAGRGFINPPFITP